jgi:hypothetical protein
MIGKLFPLFCIRFQLIRIQKILWPLLVGIYCLQQSCHGGSLCLFHLVFIIYPLNLSHTYTESQLVATRCILVNYTRGSEYTTDKFQGGTIRNDDGSRQYTKQ